MASSGHGVSDAVRNHIPVWVTDEVAKALGEPAATLRDPLRWKRKCRRNSPSGYGFEREFECVGLPGVKLIVHSPPDDHSANRYVFVFGSKAIGGGKTKLKSTYLSSTVSKDTTEMEDTGFSALSEKELRKIMFNLSHGNKDDFAFLELERG